MRKVKIDLYTDLKTSHQREI